MVIRRYTDAERAFLRAFIPGHTYKEIVAEFNKVFDNLITEPQVKSYMSNHGIKNGLTGRFKKGNIP
ncbi:MAG: HNH endonuclease, partial [Oscillospiraceae bacterium]|nr:HNH endonuclease [Oscillospiraceae bacterium]